jgi:hypothetical protein
MNFMVGISFYPDDQLRAPGSTRSSKIFAILVSARNRSGQGQEDRRPGSCARTRRRSATRRSADAQTTQPVMTRCSAREAIVRRGQMLRTLAPHEDAVRALRLRWVRRWHAVRVLISECSIASMPPSAASRHSPPPMAAASRARAELPAPSQSSGANHPPQAYSHATSSHRPAVRGSRASAAEN